MAEINLEFTPSSIQVKGKNPLGVNAGPYVHGGSQSEAALDKLTQAYQLIGVSSIRTHDFYGPFDVSAMSNHFALQPREMDMTGVTNSIKAAAEAGCEIYLRIGESYPLGTDQVWLPNMGDLLVQEQWAEYAMEILRNVVRETDHFGIEFSCIEIWNEPDLEDRKVFWNSYPWSAFTSFYIILAEKIQEEYGSRFRIGGAGFTQDAAQLSGSASDDSRKRIKKWLQDLADARTSHPNLPLDFLSFHIYGESPGYFAEHVDRVRNWLDDTGFSGTPVHITEFNLPVGEDPRRTTGEGPAIITGAWIRMILAGAQRLFFFRGVDNNRDSHFGLLTVDGANNSMANAFNLWAEFWQKIESGGQLFEVQSSGTGSNDLEALAVVAGDGDTASLLITNPGSKKRTISANWNLLIPIANQSLIMQVVLANGEFLKRSIDPSSLIFELFPNETALIEMQSLTSWLAHELEEGETISQTKTRPE